MTSLCVNSVANLQKKMFPFIPVVTAEALEDVLVRCSRGFERVSKMEETMFEIGIFVQSVYWLLLLLDEIFILFKHRTACGNIFHLCFL